MITVGNHYKIHVSRALRAQTDALYRGALEAKPRLGSSDDTVIYELAASTPMPTIVGIFYRAESEVLTSEEHLRATWLELKSSDVAATKARLVALGVREVETPDKARFFFQAPGGQVYRLASFDDAA